MPRYEGVVRWFSPGRGYGFLGAEGMEDVFCHFSAIESDGFKTLLVADAVSFEIEAGPTGRFQATRVRRLVQSR